MLPLTYLCLLSTSSLQVQPSIPTLWSFSAIISCLSASPCLSKTTITDILDSLISLARSLNSVHFLIFSPVFPLNFNFDRFFFLPVNSMIYYSCVLPFSEPVSQFFFSDIFSQMNKFIHFLIVSFSLLDTYIFSNI